MQIQVSMISLLQGLAVTLEKASAIPQPELKRRELSPHWHRFLSNAQGSLDLFVEITEGRPRNVVSCITLDGRDGKLHLVIDDKDRCVLKLEREVEKEIDVGMENVNFVAECLLEGFQALSPKVIVAWGRKVQHLISFREAGWDILISVDDPRILIFLHSEEGRVEKIEMTPLQVCEWVEVLGMIPRIWGDRPRVTSDYATRARSITEATPGAIAFWRDEIEAAELPIREKFEGMIYEAAQSLNQLLEGAREAFVVLLPEDNNWVSDALLAGRDGFIP